jgi:hypothetical protein
MGAASSVALSAKAMVPCDPTTSGVARRLDPMIRSGRRQPCRGQRQRIVPNDQPTLRSGISAGGSEVRHPPIANFGCLKIIEGQLGPDPAILPIHDDFEQSAAQCVGRLLSWLLPTDLTTVGGQLF